MENDKLSEAVDGIAADLFATSDAPTEETTTDETPSESPSDTPAETSTAVPTETAAPVARAAPKAWPKEQHERWGKLDKETQDYLELRERQMLDGLSQYGDKAKRSDAWDTAVKDYMPLIQAQNIQPQEAVRYLFEAHRQLSSGTPQQKQAYLAQIAKSYGIAIPGTVTPAGQEETPAQRETRERLERLENERAQDKRAAAQDMQKHVAGEVTSFADAKDDKGTPTHPYFDECAEDIVALINAGHTLEQAYEKAVYANPVTRAKELERQRKIDDEALRAKAKQEAEKARNASRTNVNSRDTRREPTAPKAKRWEDTMDETMKEIKSRTH